MRRMSKWLNDVKTSWDTQIVDARKTATQNKQSVTIIPEKIIIPQEFWDLLYKKEPVFAQQVDGVFDGYITYPNLGGVRLELGEEIDVKLRINFSRRNEGESRGKYRDI